MPSYEMKIFIYDCDDNWCPSLSIVGNRNDATLYEVSKLLRDWERLNGLNICDSGSPFGLVLIRTRMQYC